jgi:glycosyltransferase 2 family protein
MVPSRNSLLRIVLALVGAGLLVFLVARIGPGAIASHLANVGFGFIWLFVAYGAGTMVGALPWYWLLPNEARPRIRDAIASRFAASGGNAVLFAVGGEPSRLLWLRPEHRAVGLAGVVVDRLLFAAASVLFLLVGLVTVLQIAELPPTYLAVATALALLALAGAGVVAWVAATRGIAGRIHRAVHRMRNATTASLPSGALGDGVDERLAELLKRRRDSLWSGVGVHLVARTLLGVEIYAGLLVLGVSVSPAEGLVLASVPVVLAIVGSWIPSQIGVQEGAVALVCGLLGIDPAAGLTVVMLQRIRQVGTVSLAWILVSRMARRPPATADEHADVAALSVSAPGRDSPR